MWNSFALCLLSWLFSTEVKAAELPPVITRFNSVIDMLGGIVSYYEIHYAESNLDGIFGPVILRDSIRRMLYTHQYPDAVHKQLSSYLKSLNSVLSSASITLKVKDKDYFNKLGRLIQIDWAPKSTFILEQIFYEPFEKQTSSFGVFPEEVSDRCLHEILKLNSTEQRCQLPTACKKALYTSNLQRYEATHVVLYLLVIEKLACQDLVDSQLSEWGLSIDWLLTNHCNNIYSEFTTLLHGTPASVYVNRDLLLEQIFVCGYRGFEMFVKLSFLDTIKSWQNPSGCFADRVSPELPVAVTSRKLLFEEELKDGCLIHLTSVATAALSVYLNSFLRPMDSRMQNDNALLRKIETYYSVHGNPNMPPLLPDVQPNKADEVEPKWVPSVDVDLISKLGRPHGLMGIMIYPGLRSELKSPNRESANVTLYIVPFLCTLCFLITCMLLCRRSRGTF